MQALEFLHAVESFIGRDLSESDGDAVIEMAEEGDRTVQHVAELMMTREDFDRAFGCNELVAAVLKQEKLCA